MSFSICYRCSKEPSHRDGSFEYPQRMFWLRNKKIIFLLHTLKACVQIFHKQKNKRKRKCNYNYFYTPPQETCSIFGRGNKTKVVVLLLLTFCLLLLPLWESVIVLCLLYVTLFPF